MKLLALTLAAVLCALLLQQATGAATGRTEEQKLLASTLAQLSGQLSGNSSKIKWLSGLPSIIAPKALSAGYATQYDCYQCTSIDTDGVDIGDKGCDDPFPGGDGVKIVKCNFCGKMVITASDSGSKVRQVARTCEATNCGTTDLSGKVNNVKTTIAQRCCTGDKCNGTPSVNYTSKIFVASLGLLLTMIYSL